MNDDGVYIGCDLDGTLATYDEWKSWQHIGEPIKTTVDRVKLWLSMGIEVRIVTARVSEASAQLNNVSPSEIKRAIQDWCEKNIGYRLTVQCEKDCNMLFLIDDSCVQVVTNSGVPIGGDEAFRVFEDRIKESVMHPCKFKVGDRMQVPTNVKSKDRGLFGTVRKVELQFRDKDPDTISSAPAFFWLVWYQIDGWDTMTGCDEGCLLPVKQA